MLTALKAQVSAHQQSLTNRPHYLACSGGRDSLSLAFACFLLYQAGELPTLPTLIHINHRLQAVSDTWAKQVADFASVYGFDCRVIELNLAKSNEQTARNARYQAFFETMAEGGILWLAHHANDQAETLLMRLVNGAGVAGLSAMGVWQNRAVADKSLSLFRPLLTISRDEISDFAKSHQLPYVDDPTNTAGDNARSLIRRELLPILDKLNPKAVQNIARSAFLLGNANELINEQINAFYQNCLDNSSQAPFFYVLKINELLQFSPIIQSELIRKFIQDTAPYPPSSAMSERVLALCHRNDNNHQSELFWQASDELAFVFVRYRERLYRYRADVWAFLKGETDAFVFDIPPNFQPLTLPKKHRQRLAIPSWLARHLWVGQVDGQKVVLTLGFAVLRDGGECGKNVFALAICPKVR